MIYAKDDVIQKNEFPFDIFNGNGQNNHLPSEKITVHNHDCLEINYVVHGGGYYLIGNNKYELHTGDICLINNQEYHMAMNTGMLMLKVIVFNADLIWNGSQMDYMYLKAFFERKENYEPFFKAGGDIAEAVTPIIFALDKEWREKKPGYRILIKADLMKMLAMIYRYYQESESFDDQAKPPWKNYHCVTQAVDYINSHYQERLTLGGMAEMVHMSENYFSTVFREVVQMPFSKYVLEKRLDHACMLLKTTNIHITAVALQSGFENISYFNRVFKKKYGGSPGRYRSDKKILEESAIKS